MTKPMSMQLNEPEFMCQKCGYKFYLQLDENNVIMNLPTNCEHCDEEFDWRRKEK